MCFLFILYYINFCSNRHIHIIIYALFADVTMAKFRQLNQSGMKQYQEVNASKISAVLSVSFRRQRNINKKNTEPENVSPIYSDTNV